MERPGGQLYEIIVREPIDPTWSEWLEDFAITRIAGKETRISGYLQDQTALYGLIDRMRDLNLTLILVRRVD